MNIHETLNLHKYLKKRIAEALQNPLSIFSQSFLKYRRKDHNSECPYWENKQDNGTETLGFYLEKKFEQALVTLIMTWSSHLPWHGGRSRLYEILYNHYWEHVRDPHTTKMGSTVIVVRPECWSVHKHHYLAKADEKKRVRYILKRLKEAVCAFDSLIKILTETQSI